MFWLPQGRLGNLIFQYQAAISLFPEASKIISLESEFQSVFESNQNFHFVHLPKIPKIRGLWVKVLRWCALHRIISSVTPEWDVVCGEYPVETRRIFKKSGWFSSVWVLEGWFQYDPYPIPQPKIKMKLLEKAEAALSHIPYENRVAVHLRFGDYATWTILGKKGVFLPNSYYAEAMERQSKKLTHPMFVIFSDDINRAEEIIGKKSNTLYFEGKSPGEDLVGISRCSHAIISASTFSWWGAYLIDNPSRTVIGPKYWAGFKSETWYPPDIGTNKFEYINVLEKD